MSCLPKIHPTIHTLVEICIYVRMYMYMYITRHINVKLIRNIYKIRNKKTFNSIFELGKIASKI